MKKQALLFLFFLLSLIGSAQNKIIGIVVDEKGAPLIGVSVVERSESNTKLNGTVTDFDGRFVLTTKQSQGTLSFSYIGYISMSKSFKVPETIRVTMRESKNDLNEVVVTGYGTQKKISVVGSVSTVTTKELVQSPAANLSNALAGRLSGLTTVQNTGQPGKDDASLYIRGRSTWVNASPLFIVDGVERENFTQIDANEVESISILKDAAETAVYGVRGANGVIIITTKRGKEKKPVVSMSAQFGLQKPVNLPNFLNSYETASLRNEAYLNDGYPIDKLPFQPAALDAFKNHTDPYHYPDVDWYKEVLKSQSPQAQYNFNVQGGTRTARYFLSTGYLFQDGLFNTNQNKDYNTNFRYNRFNFRTNLDVDISEDFILSLGISARMEDTNEPGATGYTGGEIQSAFSALTRTTPYETPVFQRNGKPGVGPAGVNPWLQVNGFGYTQNKKDIVESTLSLNYKLDKITKGLSAKALISYDSYYTEQKVFSKNSAVYRLDSGADEEDNYTVFGEDTNIKYTGGYMNGYAKFYAEGSLNYVKKINNHNVTALLLGNMEDKTYSGVYIPYRNMGVVGKVLYDYKQKYFGIVNIGYNGSENFARGKRFGFFPAFGLGWVVSSEDFFTKYSDKISFLKLRATYGLVGNDKIGGGRFMYTEEYSSRNGWESPSIPSFGVNPQEVGIITLTRIANPDLTWEKSNKFNLGVDANFFDDHLTTNIDAFYENRWDILMDRNSIPLYLGVRPPSANIGKTRNIGFELEAKYSNKIGDDLNYWLKGTWSVAKNTVIAKDEPANKIPWQKEEGYSIGQFYGYQVLGMFDITDFNEDGSLKSEYATQLVGEAPKPGDFHYKDVNKDGVVDDRDKVAIGQSDIPVGSIGLSYGFDWKGLDFSMLWQGSYGVSLKINSEMMYEFCEGGKVQDFHMNRWAYYNDPFTGELVDTRATATYPRLHSQSSSPNWTTNDFFLYNSSYIKLRNVEIGYELPIPQLKLLGISRMRIYVNSNNLLTISRVKQVDPEGPGYGGNKERGWSYPQLTLYNTGISVTF